MDERSPNPPIPIAEGVNRLKLGVGDPRLHEGREAVVVEEVQKIRHQPGNVLRGRGHVCRVERIERRPTYPVLRNAYAVERVPVGQQAPLEAGQVLVGDPWFIPQHEHRLPQHGDVLGDQSRGLG